MNSQQVCISGFHFPNEKSLMMICNGPENGSILCLIDRKSIYVYDLHSRETARNFTLQFPLKISF